AVGEVGGRVALASALAVGRGAALVDRGPRARGRLRGQARAHLVAAGGELDTLAAVAVGVAGAVAGGEDRGAGGAGDGGGRAGGAGASRSGSAGALDDVAATGGHAERGGEDDRERRSKTTHETS